MKFILFSIISLMSLTLMSAQSNTKPMRTIEVTGTSKKSIDPQEIVFTITVQEYWEEEFQGKKYEDFKTKVEIDKIETALINELKQLGIGLDKITLRQTGNYWRSRGKDFLVSKTLDIKLRDFAKANEISTVLKTRGIQNMNVSKLHHDDLDQIQLEVKMNAIKAAKEKAEAMASVLGKKVKDVVSIVEIDKYFNVAPPHRDTYMMARSANAEMAQSGGVEYENFRKIEAESSVRVVFEIE